MVNEARIGMNRAVFITDVLDWYGLGDGNATLGIPGGQAKPGLSSIAMGNGVSNIGSTAVIEDNVTNTFHYGDTLTINRNRHLMKMGGQWLRYQQNRFYPGNNGLLGSIRVQRYFHWSCIRRLPARPARAEGPRQQLGHLGAPTEPHWPVLPGRLQDAEQPDVDPRHPLGVHVTCLRGPRSPVELRHRDGPAVLCGPGRQQPGALRAVLQGLRAPTRVRVDPDDVRGQARGPRGVRYYTVHGGDRLEPAPAAQSAVLLRGGHQFRQIVRRRHDQPWLHRRNRSRSAGRTHPGMESRSATAIHPAVEPHVRVRGGALHRCHARLRRQQGDAPGCPDRLEPAAARERVHRRRGSPSSSGGHSTRSSRS